MKNINIIIITLVLFGFTSCDEFLESKEKDKIIPSKVVHLKEFLLGEVIQKSADNTQYLPIMSDDIENYAADGFKSDKSGDYWGYYTWQFDPAVGKDNGRAEDKAWEVYYHDIFICNVILDQIEDMDGMQEEKDKIAAEAYFMRANAYFLLVNLYGEPYNKENADNLMGVPINNETGIESKKYNRSSVKEVYDKIESDLEEAIALFEKSGDNQKVTRPNLAASYLLKSRVALYKNEYKDVIEVADKLFRLRNYKMNNLNTTSERYFLSLTNPELIFCYGKKKTKMYKVYSRYSVYNVSTSLKALLKDNDLRKKAYYPSYYKYVYKFHAYSMYGKIYRMAEGYLNKAEALLYNSEEGWKDAIKLVNDYIRKNRIKEGTEYELVATSKEEAIKLIHDERRIELCFEGHRWFDLRRYGMPELKHRYGTPKSYYEYVLEENSKSYTLPIPKDVIDNNTKIKQIERKSQPNIN